jgi:hypothetical protein
MDTSLDTYHTESSIYVADIREKAMDWSTAVNSFGLLFDIAGATLIWFFGLPDLVGQDNVVIAGDPSRSELAKLGRYNRWSRFGIGLLILGFALQCSSSPV